MNDDNAQAVLRLLQENGQLKKELAEQKEIVERLYKQLKRSTDLQGWDKRKRK